MEKTFQHSIFLIFILPSILLILVGIMVNILLYNRDANNLKNHQEVAIEDAATSISTEINNSILTALSLRAFHRGSNEVTKEEFVRFSSDLMDSIEGQNRTIALEWVDDKNIVRFIYPLNVVNSKAIDFDNNLYPDRLSAILEAKNTRLPVATEPIELIQGFPGVIIYVPVYKEEVYQGCAIAVVKLSDYLRNISSDIKKGSNSQIVTDNVVFTLNGEAIYNINGKQLPSPLDKNPTGKIDVMSTDDHTMVKKIAFINKSWELRYQMNYEVEACERIIYYVLVTIMFIVPIIVLLGLNYRSHIRTSEMYKKENDLRKNLEREVSNRVAIEETIQKQNIELQKSKEEMTRQNAELKRMNDLMMGRELKMVELKKQVEKGANEDILTVAS